MDRLADETAILAALNNEDDGFHEDIYTKRSEVGSPDALPTRHS